MDPVGMEYWSAKMFGVRSAMMSGDILPFRGCPGLNSVRFLHGGNAKHTGEFLPTYHGRSHRPQPVSPKDWKRNMGYLKGIRYKVYYYWRYTRF